MTFGPGAYAVVPECQTHPRCDRRRRHRASGARTGSRRQEGVTAMATPCSVAMALA